MSSVTTKLTTCPECEAEEDWGGASWCPACGYYPAVNQHIAPPPVEEETVYENWWEIIPGWVWLTATGIGVLFVISVAVRLMFAESAVRTWWTIAQMGLGVIGLCSVHMMAYFYGVGRSDKLGPLDMFLQPMATWQPVLKDLPGSSHLISSMGCSIAAIALGYFVVGGVDVVAIMQQDAATRKQARAVQAAKDAAEGKKKTSMMGMMLQGATAVAQAKEAMSPTDTGPPPESLEEALESFAGAAPLTGDGTLDALANGGGGGGEMGGLGGALAGFTGAGGIDVDSYIDQQKAIASGGDGSASGGMSMASGLAGAMGAGGATAGPLISDPTRPDTGPGDMSSSESTAIRRPDKQHPQKSKDRNVRLPSDSGTGLLDLTSRGTTSPVSTERAPAGTTDATPPISVASGALTLPKEEVECVVLGYTTNASGEMRSLLLAAAPDRKHLRFVAKVPVDQVNADVLATLVSRFTELSARRPFVRCPYGGRWVEPELFCAAIFDGWTADNRMNNPEVTRVLDMRAE